MFRKPTNKFLSIGMLVVAATLSLKYFVKIPDFILGLGFGLGIGLEIYGALSQKYDMSKFKSFKRRLFRLQ